MKTVHHAPLNSSSDPRARSGSLDSDRTGYHSSENLRRERDGWPASSDQGYEERRRPIRWGALIRYWLWQLATKLILGVVYFAIVSEGARRLVPSLGQKIYRLAPFLDRLDHRLDGAHCFAIFILVGCWWSWTWLLQMWLGIKFYTYPQKLVIIPLALAFIVVDLLMFYFAVAHWNWGGASLSYTAMLATAGYLAVLVFVTFVGINFKEEITKDAP